MNHECNQNRECEHKYYTVSPINGVILENTVGRDYRHKHGNDYVYVDESITATNIDPLLAKVRAGLPSESMGATDEGMLYILRDTIKRICRDTRILTRRYSFILQQGIHTYPVYSCENEFMTSVVTATVSGYHHNTWDNVGVRFNTMANEVVFPRELHILDMIGADYQQHTFRANIIFTAEPEEDFCYVDENLIHRFSPDIVKIARSEIIKTYFYNDNRLLSMCLREGDVIQILMRIKDQANTVLKQSIRNTTGEHASPRNQYGVRYE